MTTKKGIKLKTNYTKGFTLLEVIAAIFILTVGISGSFALIEQLLVSVSLAEDKLAASYLAQEGIEIVRNIRDTNWLQARTAPASWDDGLSDGAREADYSALELTPYNNNGRFLKIDGGFYNYDSGVETKFKRKIILVHEGLNEIKTEALVEWEERGRSHTINVLESITNWYAR